VELDITLDQLRGLIGVQVYYQTCDCVIIEVLEDGPSIVLQAYEATCIQHDQHGEAHRHVPRTMAIPVLSPDKTELSAALLSLDLIEPD
jgi:hypothetical protein